MGFNPAFKGLAVSQGSNGIALTLTVDAPRTSVIGKFFDTVC